MALLKSKQIQSVDMNKVALDVDKHFLSDTQISAWDAKYDAVNADLNTDGLITSEDFVKLESVQANANFYEHDDFHPATMITEDDNHKFVTVDEKTSWSDKYTKNETDDLLSNMHTGLEWKASVATRVDPDSVIGLEDIYPNPSEGYVVSVDDEGGQTYRYDSENGWEKFLSMVYNTAIASTNFGDGDGETGLMTGDDKFKLDTVQVDANHYTHPDNHLPTVITQDDDHNFVSVTEKDAWNAKAETTEATPNDKGLMSAADKDTLDKGVSYQKDLVLPISSDGQDVVYTDVGFEDPGFSHETNVIDGEVYLNGFKQTPGIDYTIFKDSSGEVRIKWESTADFLLESTDVLIFTFTKLV